MFGKPLAAFFTVAAAALSVSALTIDTPKNLTQCNTVTLTWHGNKAPFVLAVLPSCDSGIEEPLLELPPMNVTTYQWTVNVPSKTGSIAFAITDIEGNEAYTDEVEVGKSDNVVCMSSASSSSSTPSSVAPTSTKAAATSGSVRTTLTVTATSATSTPSTPVNVGGNSGGNSSGNGGGNASTASSNVSGAIANTASGFASMIGVATGLLVLL